MNKYFQTNQSLWDQKTEVHKDSDFYDMPGFLKGRNSLGKIEQEALGDVSGKSLLHLQCHFGQDSLSWARLGAKVTGIDFSEKAIELARSLNDQLGLDARFVQSDVLELPNKLEGQYDIVFTSYGVLVWLNNLLRWASVVRHFLKEGGIFYLLEFHPVLYMYDDFGNMALSYHYFHNSEPYEELMEGTYADRQAPIQHKEYFWQHSLSEIINPLIAEGLQLQAFKEYDYSPYNCFEGMHEVAPDQYRFNKVKIRFPYVFSLKMTK